MVFTGGLLFSLLCGRNCDRNPYSNLFYLETQIAKQETLMLPKSLSKNNKWGG